MVQSLFSRSSPFVLTWSTNRAAVMEGPFTVLSSLNMPPFNSLICLILRS
uniref:Uncharacterized protein n=1 Tax=Amphimedon queenslandica TaxID=400682 RepID=A0A1X7V6H4_AMPQE